MMKVLLGTGPALRLLQIAKDAPRTRICRNSSRACCGYAEGSCCLPSTCCLLTRHSAGAADRCFKTLCHGERILRHSCGGDCHRPAGA